MPRWEPAVVPDGANGERTRTYSWDDPHELLARTAGMSGLEALRLIAAGELPPPPIGKTLGFPFTRAIRERRISCRSTISVSARCSAR